MRSSRDRETDPPYERGTCPWDIRPLGEADLEDVLAIECRSFPTPWSRNAFLEELKNPLSHCWVAQWKGPREGPHLAGYLCVWIVREEMHVMNIATHPLHRRRGVAKRLLCHALRHAAGAGVRRVVLEVRPSNIPAIALYSSMGFQVVGRRPRYYQDTGEDAVVMSLDVGEQK